MTFEPIEVSEERSCAWRLSFDDKAPRLDVTLGAAIEVFRAFWPLVRPVEIRLAFVHWLDGKQLADVHHRAVTVDASSSGITPSGQSRSPVMRPMLKTASG